MQISYEIESYLIHHYWSETSCKGWENELGLNNTRLWRAHPLSVQPKLNIYVVVDYNKLSWIKVQLNTSCFPLWEDKCRAEYHLPNSGRRNLTKPRASMLDPSEDVYNKRSRGIRTDPCGTPVFTWFDLDTTPFCKTLLDLPERWKVIPRSESWRDCMMVQHVKMHR